MSKTCVPHTSVCSCICPTSNLLSVSTMLACTGLEAVWAVCKGWSTLHSPGILKLAIIVCSELCELVWLLSTADFPRWNSVVATKPQRAGKVVFVCVSRRFEVNLSLYMFAVLTLLKCMFAVKCYTLNIAHTKSTLLLCFTVWWSVSFLCTKQCVSAVVSLALRPLPM